MTSSSEPVDQVRYGQQAINGKRAPASRDHHKRVRRSHIGPPCWQREQLPVPIVQVDPVLTPVLPVSDELEVTPIQRMEPMRHTDTLIPIMQIGCS